MMHPKLENATEYFETLQDAKFIRGNFTPFFFPTLQQRLLSSLQLFNNGRNFYDLTLHA